MDDHPSFAVEHLPGIFRDVPVELIRIAIPEPVGDMARDPTVDVDRPVQGGLVLGYPATGIRGLELPPDIGREAASQPLAERPSRLRPVLGAPNPHSSIGRR